MRITLIFTMLILFLVARVVLSIFSDIRCLVLQMQKPTNFRPFVQLKYVLLSA